MKQNIFLYAPFAGEDNGQNPFASTIYLWPEGNMVKVTNYTGSQGAYQDPPSFRPYMNYFPAAEHLKGFGAVSKNTKGIEEWLRAIRIIR